MGFVLENTNTISSRLSYLYSLKGIDTNKKGWYLSVVDSMKSAGLLVFDDNKSRAYNGHVIDGHIKRPPKSGLSFEWIDRYCKYFNCSADYIMGYIEAPNHDQKTVEELTGLSQESAAVLLNKSNNVAYILDNLLSAFDSKTADLKIIRTKNLQRSFWHYLYNYFGMGYDFQHDIFLSPLFKYWNDHRLNDVLSEIVGVDSAELEEWKNSVLNNSRGSLTEYEYQDRNFNALFKSYSDYYLMGIFRTLVELHNLEE